MEVTVRVMVQWIGFKQEGTCCHSLLQLQEGIRQWLVPQVVKFVPVDWWLTTANVLTGSAIFVALYHSCGHKLMTPLQRWFGELHPHFVPAAIDGQAAPRIGHPRR
jgi:hypothetical protein